MSIDLSKLLTERRNANSANIDTLSTVEMLTVINQEDRLVAEAITPICRRSLRLSIRSPPRCRRADA